MKCKPNQLVRYVGPNPLNRPNIFGWVGTTVEFIKDRRGIPCWRVDPPLPGGTYLSKEGSAVKTGRLVDERFLKPIENPDEDAVDQMVLLVGKPKKEDKVLTV